MSWVCGIDDCVRSFDDPESLIVHQTNEHERVECKVCGTIVPDGYLAIRHTFDEHTRAQYVRAYGGNSADVRTRERIKDTVEAEADLEGVVSRLEG